MEPDGDDLLVENLPRGKARGCIAFRLIPVVERGARVVAHQGRGGEMEEGCREVVGYRSERGSKRLCTSDVVARGGVVAAVSFKPTSVTRRTSTPLVFDLRNPSRLSAPCVWAAQESARQFA